MQHFYARSAMAAAAIAAAHFAQAAGGPAGSAAGDYLVGREALLAGDNATAMERLNSAAFRPDPVDGQISATVTEAAIEADLIGGDLAAAECLAAASMDAADPAPLARLFTAARAVQRGDVTALQNGSSAVMRRDGPMSLFVTNVMSALNRDSMLEYPRQNLRRTYANAISEGTMRYDNIMAAAEGVKDWATARFLLDARVAIGKVGQALSDMVDPPDGQAEAVPAPRP